MKWGVDIGVRSLAMVGLPEHNDVDLDPQLFYFEVEKSTRWNELGNLTRLFQERIYYTDTVFIEEPPLAGSRNVRTFLGLAQTHGALLAVAAGRSYVVPVGSWKKAVTGNGSATKELVKDWLAINRPELHSRAGTNQNLVDAACIAVYGEQVQGENL